METGEAKIEFESDTATACARAAHEVNRAYCIALGDLSHVSWDETPTWQRESALASVEGVLAGNGPRMLHGLWTAHKIGTGWKYGPIKDVAAREHPCLVDYDALPESQRLKDDLFIATVLQVASALMPPCRCGCRRNRHERNIGESALGRCMFCGADRCPSFDEEC